MKHSKMKGILKKQMTGTKNIAIIESTFVQTLWSLQLPCKNAKLGSRPSKETL